MKKAESSWKALIDVGVFDDCFPQRVNASFHYLAHATNDESYFYLKDLVDKGAFVLSYLSIDSSKQENVNFAMMDLFRSFFDRSACGFVDIVNFVLGVIDKLMLLR